MHNGIFDALLVTFALAIGVVWVCDRLRVPAIVGFLLSGTLAGPHGFGLVGSSAEVEELSEMGVILLLFTIGVEFSLRRMVQIRRLVLVGGALQVGLTIAAVWGLAWGLGLPPRLGLFLGFLASLSSTAIVLKTLQERGEVDSPQGSAMTGILIFQDVIVVPMMLVTPQLGGDAGFDAAGLGWTLVKAALVVGLVLAAARWVVPPLLHQVARSRSREVFLLAVVIICLAAARATHLAGLSLALGAFLAGLAVSESEYSHHSLGSVLPLRDIFTSLFFISMGMLLDVGFLGHNLVSVLGVAAAVVGLKALLAVAAVLLLGLPLRTCILAGIALAQVGEFSFILSKEGLAAGVLTENLSQLFIAGSILTMSVTPLLIPFAGRVARAVCRLRLLRRLADRPDTLGTPPDDGLRDHLVIIGFGLNGRNLARAARMSSVPYVVLEMNAETVRDQRALGEPIQYGDATRDAVLRHAGVHLARTVVVVINDPTAARGIVAAVKRISPAVHLIVRTRYVSEVGVLYDLGADEVIPEELETSVAIFTRALSAWLIPEEEIRATADSLRAEGYQALRHCDGSQGDGTCLAPGRLDIEIRPVRLPAGSAWSGRTLGELQLRMQYGVTVVAVRRDGGVVASPAADFALQGNDIVVFLGAPGDIARALSDSGG